MRDCAQRKTANFTDSLGQVWSADTNTSGATYSTASTIAGTPDPALYKKERYADRAILQYQFAAPTGSYNVKLKFAEIYYTAPNQRTFNIVINGTTVTQNFDIFAVAGGAFKAVDKDFTVNSTGQIVIQLVPVIDSPKISAIQITATASRAGTTANAAVETLATAEPACPCSIWGDTDTPSEIDSATTTAVEVGMKFRSKSAGYITGMRFYKGPENTGIHTGHLWSADGTLLASAQFENETESGWQHVSFPSPVAIAANAVYVVSYQAPNGHYSHSPLAFRDSAPENGPLQFLKDGEHGSNSVYQYGSGFPTLSQEGSNYWLDVVFESAPPAARPLPATKPVELLRANTATTGIQPAGQ